MFLFLLIFISLLSPLIVAKSASLNFTSCLETSQVPFVSASSPGYTNETNIYNVRVQYKPLAIAIPKNTVQISSALACAASSNVTVQAKSGGHSFAGFSLGGGRRRTLSISMESFQDVELGPRGYEREVAKVGAGLRLGNLALALYKKAGVGLPHGTCPGVGVGGHATHGGYGLNSRAWGLMMDAIVAMDAVLPNGTALTVSATNHPDLWYALRGAADSFAIVTAFYMRTRPVPKDLTFFQYSFGDDFFSRHNASVPTRMVLHLQDFACNASVVDSRLSMTTYLDGGHWSTSGLFHGTVGDFNSKIKPELLRTMPKPDNTSYARSVNWTESLLLLAGTDPLVSPPGAAYNLHDDFFAKSVTVPESGLLTEQSLTAFFDYIMKNGVKTPDSWYWYTIFDLYGGAGSAINKRPSADSSYTQRDTFWTFQNYGYANMDDSGKYVLPFPGGVKPFIQGLNDAIPKAQPQTRFGAYYNYVDDSLTSAEAHRLYYGEDTYAKLLALKKMIDPAMLISNPLAVGT